VEIPPDDIGDGFGFDLAFCSLGRVVDVNMEQRVGVLVDERHGEIGLIRAGFRLDDWLKIARTSIFADALRAAMLPVGSVDDTNLDTEIVRRVEERAPGLRHPQWPRFPVRAVVRPRSGRRRTQTLA